MKHVLLALAAITLVALAGIAFVTFIVVYKVLIVTLIIFDRTIGLVLYTVISLGAGIISRILDYAIVLGIGAVIFYAFMEYNPGLRYEIQHIKTSITSTIRDFTGFQLPNIGIPSPGEIYELITGRGSIDNPNPLHPDNLRSHGIDLPDIRLPSMQSVLHEADIPVNAQDIQQLARELPQVNSLSEVFQGKTIPDAIEPLIGVVKDPDMIRQFQLLAESGALGPQGEAAVPLLEYALHSDNSQLRSAAFESLKKMNTAESQEALQTYQQLIMEGLKHANPGH